MNQKTIENLKREVREIKNFLGISRGVDYKIDEENYKQFKKALEKVREEFFKKSYPELYGQIRKRRKS